MFASKSTQIATNAIAGGTYLFVCLSICSCNRGNFGAYYIDWIFGTMDAYVVRCGEGWQLFDGNEATTSNANDANCRLGTLHDYCCVHPRPTAVKRVTVDDGEVLNLRQVHRKSDIAKATCIPSLYRYE